jgi:thiamine biosynthesis lipoprotein ApbE
LQKRGFISTNELSRAFGAVLDCAHLREAESTTPETSSASIAELENLKAYRHQWLIIDEELQPFLERPAMSIDAGAIAKGYAVEQPQIFEGQGIKSRLLP